MRLPSQYGTFFNKHHNSQLCCFTPSTNLLQLSVLPGKKLVVSSALRLLGTVHKTPSHAIIIQNLSHATRCGLWATVYVAYLAK